MVVKIEAAGLTAFGIPLKDQPPLPVDPDGAEPFESSLKLFKMVARRYPQILICDSVIDHLDLAKQPRFHIGWYRFGVGIFNKEPP